MPPDQKRPAQKRQPPTLSPFDGLPRSAEHDANINRLVASVFAAPNGQELMQYLRSITVNVVVAPTQSDAHLRHQEGQRYLVGIIQARIDGYDNAQRQLAAERQDEVASNPDRPDWLPEKFENVEALGKSYAEIEKAYSQKAETFKEQIAAEMAATPIEGVPEQPDGYALPEYEDFDNEALAGSDMVNWWKQTCHASGIGQEQFEQGIDQYLAALSAGQPDAAAEVALLGENAQERISAVENWASVMVKDQGEAAAMNRLIQSAGGIALAERLMSSTPGVVPNNSDPVLSREDLETMQQDSRYNKPGHYDQHFIDRVTAGYQNLAKAGRL